MTTLVLQEFCVTPHPVGVAEVTPQSLKASAVCSPSPCIRRGNNKLMDGDRTIFLGEMAGDGSLIADEDKYLEAQARDGEYIYCLSA